MKICSYHKDAIRLVGQALLYVGQKGGIGCHLASHAEQHRNVDRFWRPGIAILLGGSDCNKKDRGKINWKNESTDRKEKVCVRRTHLSISLYHRGIWCPHSITHGPPSHPRCRSRLGQQRRRRAPTDMELRAVARYENDLIPARVRSTIANTACPRQQVRGMILANPRDLQGDEKSTWPSAVGEPIQPALSPRNGALLRAQIVMMTGAWE